MCAGCFCWVHTHSLLRCARKMQFLHCFSYSPAELWGNDSLVIWVWCNNQNHLFRFLSQSVKMLSLPISIIYSLRPPPKVAYMTMKWKSGGVLRSKQKPMVPLLFEWHPSLPGVFQKLWCVCSCPVGFGSPSLQIDLFWFFVVLFYPWPTCDMESPLSSLSEGAIFS